MNFNKYTITIGIALGFLALSINADANHPTGENEIGKECYKTYEDYDNATKEGEDSDSDNNREKISDYKRSFHGADAKCRTTPDRHNTKGYANCVEIDDNEKKCKKEKASCKWNGESCEQISKSKLDITLLNSESHHKPKRGNDDDDRNSKHARSNY